MKDILILAIESSCDETAAAVVKNGRTVLSNVINTQIAIHTEYVGVETEIASRKKIEKFSIDSQRTNRSHFQLAVLLIADQRINLVRVRELDIAGKRSE